MKGSTIFKAIFGLLVLTILGLLYWSSTLQENDLKKVSQEMSELRAETAALGQKLTRELRHRQASVDPSSPHSLVTSSQYPNLLEEDLYFSYTLPKQLGDQFKPTGIVKQAIIGRPENLHPFNGFRDVSSMIQMCSVQVADLQFGVYETMAPDMALKLEMRPCQEDSEAQEYWVHLREDVYWQPLKKAHFPNSIELAPHFLKKHKVTAYDFKFFYDAIMNPYVHEAKAASLRTYFDDIEEFRVIDAQTFVVRWKKHRTEDEEGHAVDKIKYTSLSLTGALQPLARFVYQYFADGQKIIEEDQALDTYRTNSIWAQNFAHHWAKNVIVSCGPYLFDGMSDEAISFKRNPEHYNPYAVLTEGTKYTFKESVDAVWQDFKTGKIDLCTLAPNQMMEYETFLTSDDYKTQIARNQEIQAIDYVDLSYYYIGWNQAKPFFVSEKVRKAMTLAIDRKRIIEQNLNQMAVPISGPFFRYSSAYDIAVAPYPYNPEEARRLLDEEGWIDLDGDGVRDKIIDGKTVPFRFKLYYFVKSLPSRVIAEYIMTALRDIGVHCELYGLDITDLSRQFEDKNFDAICMGWKLGTPPEDPCQLWYSSGAKEKGSSNAIGFANPEIDALIEYLNYEYDPEKREEYYHQFHRIIHELAPYTFLYTPKVRLLYRDHLQNIFVPREKQELIPGADIPEPNTQVIWFKQ